MADMRWLRGLSAKYPALRYQVRAVFWGPLIVGAVAMYFFAAIPQSREVYLAIIEDQKIIQGLLGLALIGLLCALLDCWQHMLGTNAIDRMYLEHADIYIDRRLLRLRNVLCRVSSLFPLLGLGLGLLFVTLQAKVAGTRFDEALKVFGGRGTFPELEKTFEVLSFFTLYAAAAIALIGTPSLLAMRYARSHRDRILARYSPRKLVVWAGVGLTLAAILAPLAVPDHMVGMAQAVGPLAGAAIAMIALVTVLMGLSYLSSKMRWPIMGVAVLAVLIGLLVQTYAALTPRRQDAARAAAPGQSSEHGPHQLFGTFDNWLQMRRAADGKAFSRYPVFIVSAQGGGIYAAAATSAFLAAMQDRCPNFAQHVFAVSGVSGGAIGAAIFSTSLPAELESRVGCSDPQARGETSSLSARTREVVRKDHLSPSLALIWPDLARKLVLSPDPAFDRSSVLERSFACAFDPPTPWYLCPGASDSRGKGLRMPFETHWSIEHPAPALILAATWVETGFRAAFAPFPLHAVSDGTLDSFYLSADGKGDFAAQGVDIKPDRSLIEAAFVSARFPGIVPAWQQYARTTGTTQERLWNFVDGGYVDNSGATTAHELYQKLDKHVQDGKLDVDLYLVMLTDANTDPDFAAVDDGTRFSDIVAPITALLSVRGQLAFRAVTRAIDEIEPNAKPEQLAGRVPGSRVLAVDLLQESFELPLGWKISRITDNIVRLMLGRPDLCEARIPEGARRKNVVRVIRDNSCVKMRIETLLSAKG
jgi:hypothetical protein